MLQLQIESPLFKVLVVAALIAAREFVRFASSRPVSSRTPSGRDTELSENARWVIETLDSVAMAIGLVLFVVMPFLIQAFFIPSGSMEDTLKGPSSPYTGNILDRQGDRLLVSKLVYHLEDPKFQDVVVFIAPPNAKQPPNTDFVKRCIGTPGDVVEMRMGKLYRFGKLVPEPYPKWSPGMSPAYDMKIVDGHIYSREYTLDSAPALWTINNNLLPDEMQRRIEQARPGPVPPRRYLMLGDHRNNSNDSHYWGFVPRENILGKALFVFWPPQRIALVDHLSKGYRP